MRRLKEAFAQNKHLRFRQELIGSGPFGKTVVYIQKLQDADNQKIAKLIKIAGVLMHTKVYLFWKSHA